MFKKTVYFLSSPPLPTICLFVFTSFPFPSLHGSMLRHLLKKATEELLIIHGEILN